MVVSIIDVRPLERKAFWLVTCSLCGAVLAVIKAKNKKDLKEQAVEVLDHYGYPGVLGCPSCEV